MSDFLDSVSAKQPPVELDLDLVGSKTNPVRVLGLPVISLQASNITGAWGAGVVSLERSNDGVRFLPFDPAVSVSTADGFAQTTGACCTWVQAIVTTAGTSGHKVSVAISARLN